MDRRETHCIYCSKLFDASKGDGDHVLPRGFGDFAGAILFRGICPRCNNTLSPLEEELLRTAPEAVFRRLAGATQNRRGETTGWQGASGLPAPSFMITHPDHQELMDADPVIPGQGKPVDQLILELKDGRHIPIRLFPLMTPDSLRRKIVQLGIDEAQIRCSRWKCDEKHEGTYRTLIRETWPDFQHHDLPTLKAGMHRVPVRIECRFTTKYYRAIAKIAFHYLLAQSRCSFTGHEAVFTPIREFITNGGEHEPFFEARKLAIAMPVGVLPDGTARLPQRWMHLLCGFESAASAVVAVYTLFGPRRPPDPYFVTLFHRPSRIAVQQHRYGHAYVYGDPELGDTRVAFVEPFSIDATP